jgi:hypothetical protein
MNNDQIPLPNGNYVYAMHALGWFVVEREVYIRYSPIMVMDDFGNAVVPACAAWPTSLSQMDFQ